MSEKLQVEQNTTLTSRAYLATRLLDTPLWAIYNILPIILYKELHASTSLIALLITIRPVVSIFSLYWSDLTHNRPDRLKTNVITGRLIGLIPFLFTPWIHNAWYLVAASAIFMAMMVGMVPAWMEILKQNLSDYSRKTTFAYGSSIGYLGGGILPIFFGWMLDAYPSSWRFIFPLVSLLAFISIPFVLWITIKELPKQVEKKKTFFKTIISPWISSFHLLKSVHYFAMYQAGFMTMGIGLMIIQPALPAFFVDELAMSYSEIAIALSLCKGVSYALASPLWAKWMRYTDIFRFSAQITAFGCLFPLLLIFAKWELSFLFLAYMLYGSMQAGSEMSWHMSGPIFSKDSDSAPYTSVNVVAVGIRGLFAPALGSLICGLTNPIFVLTLGSLFFISATFLMLRFGKTYQKQIA